MQKPAMPFAGFGLLRRGARWVLPIVILAAYVALALAFSRRTPVYNPYGTQAGGKIYYEYAAVESIDEQSVSPSRFEGLYTGRQVITVRMHSGTYRGKTFQVNNSLNYDTNFLLHKGQSVVVSVNTSTGDKSIVNVYVFAPNRIGPILALVGLFVALLCFVGGRRGFRSVLGIVFTLTSTLFVFLPMLLRGAPPVTATMVLATVTSCVTLFLVGGVSLKSLSAVLSTVLGVMVSAVLLFAFSAAMQISGYTLGDADALLNIAGQSRLQMHGLLYAGIIISSLGAVMDIAISVATSVNEVLQNRPDASFSELFRSGIHVGRDMMGTMANTLILAFIGSSVETFILMYSYQTSVNQMLNSNNIASTILESVCGSLAVICTVPIVSAIAARLLPGKQTVPVSPGGHTAP